MRRGRLFEENKEKVSVFFYSTLTRADVYSVRDVDAVFYPNTAPILAYSNAALSQTRVDADWIVILDEKDEGINKTDTLIRESDDTEYEIVDILDFAGNQHLFVKSEGI